MLCVTVSLHTRDQLHTWSRVQGPRKNSFFVHSCEMDLESGNSINPGPLATPIMTTNLSRRLSSSNQLSGLLATPGSTDYRLNADYNADSDHARITMKTRVAVRDKAPHRFQVVPLHDVSKHAALEAGRPSHLALPFASRGLLRSASIRRQNCSQVRPAIASSYSQLDINARDKCDLATLVDNETLTTSCAEILPIPVLALSPSFELDNLGRSHILVEQDMNRQCPKSTPNNKFEGSVTIPTTPFYDASYHTHVQNPVTLFSDRTPSIHAMSQPLDLASCNGGAYHKMKSNPEHLFEPIQPSITDSKSRKRRTRSENIQVPSIRDNNQRASRNGPTVTVTQDSYDSRLTKRHAIYTQSLYAPLLESPNYFPARSTESRKGHHQLFGVHPNENVVSFTDFVSDSGATLSTTNSDDRNSPTPPNFLEAAPSEEPLQVLKPWGLAIVPHKRPYRGLNYRRLSCVYPLSAETRSHVVYPQIVLEMFTDINRAIQEWKYT